MTQMMPPTMPPPVMAPPAATRSGFVDAQRGNRLLASIIDTACFVVMYLIAYAINEPLFVVFGIAGLVGYQMYLLTTLGQTIGKKAMNIKIVKTDTEENGGFVTNVLIRGILNGIIGFVPFYALVDILFIFREDRRCIHDLIASTRVVEA